MEPQNPNLPPPAAAVPAVVELPKFSAEREMIEFGELFNEPELARTMAAEGKNLAELRAKVAEKRAAAATQVEPKPAVTLTERELNKYSVSRGILAHSAGEESFETEVSNELRGKLGIKTERGGLLIPTNAQLVKRAGLDSKTATKGAEIVFTEPGSFIEMLRNRALVIQIGATVLAGLQGNVAFPKQSGAGSSSWVAENPGSDVGESNLLLEQVTMTPKTLQSTTSFSRQLLAQGIVDADALVMADLAKINALAVDLAAIHGSGASNQPKGIYAGTNVNSVAFGGSVTFAKLVDMESAINADNADMGSMAYLTTPGVKGKAKQTQEFSGTNGFAVWRENEMNGYPAFASNNVKANLGAGTNEHGIILGVWSELLIGEWGALEIITDPYRLKKQGMIEVTSFLLCDIARRYDEAFCVGTGLIP
jgi:HK97 family phage major capsid protein